MTEISIGLISFCSVAIIYFLLMLWINLGGHL